MVPSQKFLAWMLDIEPEDLLVASPDVLREYRDFIATNNKLTEEDKKTYRRTLNNLIASKQATSPQPSL